MYNEKHLSPPILPANIVFVLVTMALLALPAILYFSQKNQIGDIRNRAAEIGPYTTCAELGYTCVPNNFECTDAGGAVQPYLCTTGVCCNLQMTPTPTPLDTCHQQGFQCVSTSTSCNTLGGIPKPLLGCYTGYCCDLPVASPTPCVQAWLCGNPDPLNPTECGNQQYQEDAPACTDNPSCPGTQIFCSWIDSCSCPGTGSTPTPTGGISTPTKTPTPQIPPPNTSTPTPTTITSACLNVKIYKNGIQVDPSTLRPGDQVVLAVKGTQETTKAHFRINGTQLPGDTDSDPNWSETSQLNASGEYIFAYTIPSGIVHILVEAEVFFNTNWF